ncbi:transcriptional regulator [Paenibacillus rhizoplanae]
MEDLNWGLIAPLLALQVVLAIIGLISLSKTEQVRGPKWMWVLFLIFLATCWAAWLILHWEGKNSNAAA